MYLFGLLYDKLLVFDVIEKFEGKFKRQSSKILLNFKSLKDCPPKENVRDSSSEINNNNFMIHNNLNGNDATDLQLVNGSGIFSAQRKRAVNHNSNIIKKKIGTQKKSSKNLRGNSSILAIGQNKNEFQPNFMNENLQRILSPPSSEIFDFGEEAKYFLEIQSKKLRNSLSDIKRNKWNYIFCPFTFQRLQASFRDKKHIFFIFCKYFDINQFSLLTNLGFLVKKRKET